MDLQSFLATVSLFQGLSENLLRDICTKVQERQIPKSTILFMEDDPGDSLYIIRQGSFKVYRLASDGREKTLAVIVQGEWFGEMALIDDGPRSATAEALENSKVIILKKVDFKLLMDNYPPLAQQVTRVLSFRLRQTNQQVEAFAFGDVRSRIVQVLLDLYRRNGIITENGHRIEVRLTHQEIANLAGVARETASRILAELQQDELVEYSHRQFCLLDLEKLQRLLING